MRYMLALIVGLLLAFSSASAATFYIVRMDSTGQIRSWKDTDSVYVKADILAVLEDSLNEYLLITNFRTELEDSLNKYLTAALIRAELEDSLNKYITTALSETLIADSLVEVRTAYEAGIDSTMDSVLVNTINIAGLDSVRYLYGVAGDTTSPGKFYYQLSTDSLWYRADTSVSIIAIAVSVDSVVKGAVAKFQREGLFTDNDYAFTLPGIRVVNDSVIAGGVDVTDSNRTNTKKMQHYAWTTNDPTIIRLDILTHHWVWE